MVTKSSDFSSYKFEDGTYFVTYIVIDSKGCISFGASNTFDIIGWTDQDLHSLIGMIAEDAVVDSNSACFITGIEKMEEWK